MSKTIKVTIASLLAVLVLTWVGYGTYAALSSNGDQNTNNGDSGKNKSDSNKPKTQPNRQEYSLKNDGLKFSYPDQVKITKAEETNVDSSSELPRGDWIELESGNLKMSIFSAASGMGGYDNCSLQGAVCEIISTKNIKLFGEDMKMSFWKELSDTNSEPNYAIHIGPKGTKEDRDLFTYTFKSKSLKDSSGEYVLNGFSIQKKDETSALTRGDFDSSEMSNIVSVIESMQY